MAGTAHRAGTSTSWQEEVGALQQSTEGQLSVIDVVLRVQARHRRSWRAGLAAVMLLAVFASLWHGPGRPPVAGVARVPAAARVVTITEQPGGGPDAGRPPAPVTITDVAVVRQLAALVDSLLLLGTIEPVPMCPALGGIQLTFLARAGGPPLAAAQGQVGCAVQFSADGNPQPALQITNSFIPQVLKLAGLHWKVP
jgi:hypothetical protein